MILLVRSRRRWTTRSEVFSVTSSSKWRSGTRRDVLPSSNWHHIAIHAIVDNIVTVTNVAIKQIQKDNVHHFHNRKNIERLEKADLTESDEDEDDDEDELEVIESGAKKVAGLFYWQQMLPVCWHECNKHLHLLRITVTTVNINRHTIGLNHQPSHFIKYIVILLFAGVRGW